MADWNNDNPNTVKISFDIKMNEDIKDFITRMDAEFKSHELVMRKRIEQLFREWSNIDKVDIPKELYDQLLGLFTAGYQLGWNDHYNLTKEDKE